MRTATDIFFSAKSPRYYSSLPMKAGSTMLQCNSHLSATKMKKSPSNDVPGVTGTDLHNSESINNGSQEHRGIVYHETNLKKNLASRHLVCCLPSAPLLSQIPVMFLSKHGR